MKTKLTAVLAMASLLVFLTNCEKSAPEKPAEKTAKVEEQLKRGEILIGILGCDDCHTPKVMTAQGPTPDMNRRFMGHPADEVFKFDDKKAMISEQHVAIFSPGMTAAAGPWGVSYAANITSDDTGIGAWTEAMFIKAIREGKTKGLDGARPILPPMPWTGYARMTDEELKAIFAYLQTTKPINNVVPNPQTF